MKRLESEWLIYRAAIVPPNAGLTQIQETRRAFYAGATAMLGTILLHLTPGTEPAEDDLRMMDEIEQELREFRDAVQRGEA